MAISMAANRAWEREKRTLARIYKGITKRKTKIIDIPQEADDLGFTSADGLIHLAHEHPVMDGLSEEEKKFFRMGVFAHEMLHQIYSDFHILESVQFSLNPMERKVYASLFNLIEDPAIEYMSPNAIGGSVLKALRFSIQTLYNQSPPIDQSPMGFLQYANALVMFGDMGIIKGHFTDELAAEMFQKTCGRFNEAVENPSPKFRSDTAIELMNETRPLWEVIKYEDLMDLLNGLKNHDAESSSGSGSGISLPVPSGRIPSDSDRKSEARKEMIAGLDKMSHPDQNKSLGSKPSVCCERSGESAEDEETDCFNSEEDRASEDANEPKARLEPEVCTASENHDINSEDDGFSLDAEPFDGEKDFSSESDAEDKSDDCFGFDANESKTHLETGDSDKNAISESEKEKDNSAVNPVSEDDDFSFDGEQPGNDGCQTSKQNLLDEINEALDECGREDEAGEDSVNEIEVDQDDISWMSNADETSEKEMQREKEEAKETQIDESIEPNFYPKGKFNIENNSITISESAIASYADSYGQLIGRYAASISAFVKRMKRIFNTDRAKREYKKSGRVNIKRYAGARKTARIFERKTAPKGICDIAITILVDESGSMGFFDREGNKCRYQIAQECAIALAESFSRLDIPTYALGFSADEHGYSAEHYHYVKWKNSLNERYKLLQIQARGNNFDSLSVNYASEILKKKKAMHRILIVISDGLPECISISRRQGFADTKEAIRQARKDMDVLGIAIGNDCTKEIQYLYGKNFLHVTDVNAAFADISKEISGIVKAW